jgi:hypothetical protein
MQTKHPRCISQLLRRIEVNTRSIRRVNDYEYVLPVWPVPCSIRGRQATRGGIEVAANCRLLSAQELLGPDEFHASEDQSPRRGGIARTAKSIMSNNGGATQHRGVAGATTAGQHSCTSAQTPHVGFSEVTAHPMRCSALFDRRHLAPRCLLEGEQAARFRRSCGGS